MSTEAGLMTNRGPEMTDSKERRRWKLAAAVRQRLGIEPTTFYRSLIGRGKIQSRPGLTERKIEVCTGYYDDDGTLIACLEKLPINCRECTLPR